MKTIAVQELITDNVKKRAVYPSSNASFVRVGAEHIFLHSGYLRESISSDACLSIPPSQDTLQSCGKDPAVAQRGSCEYDGVICEDHAFPCRGMVICPRCPLVGRGSNDKNMRLLFPSPHDKDRMCAECLRIVQHDCHECGDGFCEDHIREYQGTFSRAGCLWAGLTSMLRLPRAGGSRGMLLPPTIS